MHKNRNPKESFKRLQELGKEKFAAILNALMVGKTALVVAQMIQGEWGKCDTVPESTLVKQLHKLREAAATGMYGEEIGQAIARGATPHVDLLDGVSTTALIRMEELSVRQRQRAMDLMDHEKANGFKFGGLVLSAHNNAITEYSVLLQDIQKMRFALGLDEFKGPVNSVKGASQTTTFSDGSSVQKQVFEAVTTLENIFNERKVSKPLFPVR